MKKSPLVLDLETKYTFRQHSDPKKLEVTVAAIYDFKDNTAKVYVEKEINKLFPLIENCSYIIGFNVKSFDLAVLQAYYPGDLNNFATFDILEDIRAKIGRRLSLNDLVSATLGKKKSGHGLMAVDYYKEGKWEELKKYCLDDVMLTKDLFQHGVDKGEIYYLDSKGKVTLKVDWKKYLNDNGSNSDMPLTLPF